MSHFALLGPGIAFFLSKVFSQSMKTCSALAIGIVAAISAFADTNVVSLLPTKDGKVLQNVKVLQVNEEGFISENTNDDGIKAKGFHKFSQFNLKDLAGAGIYAPGSVVTKQGTVYWKADIQKVTPDGLTVGYTPLSGGIGMAKIPFEQLPEDIQKKYNFDPVQAEQFRAQESLAAKRHVDAIIRLEEKGKVEREKLLEKETKLSQQFQAAERERERQLLNLQAQRERDKANLELQWQQAIIKRDTERSKRPNALFIGPVINPPPTTQPPSGGAMITR